MYGPAWSGVIAPAVAGRLIMTASLSNLAFMLGTVSLMGSRALAGSVTRVFGVALVLGLAVIFSL